jgi:outer membrane lipoprotein-sorting protein
MKILAIFSLAIFFLSHDDLNSVKVLKQMYDRYSGKWFRSFTFVQTTERYKGDSLTQTSTWYEAILFPDKFRIDFGDIKNGDAVIYANDSAYNFRKGKLTGTRLDNNDLTFLLGGLYFYSFDKVISQVKALHYDLDKFHTDTWNNKPVYVIGASTRDEKVNQLWVDKEKLVLVRFIKYDDNRKEEGLLEDQQKFGGGWSETKATFYIDDKLIQKEYYHECKFNVALDPRIFQPAGFGSTHWYLKN